jgi:hypothetical protein
MTPKFKSHLRNIDQKSQLMPRESAWLKLESKLQSSRNTEVKVRKYKNVSIAAVMIAVAACMSILYFQNSDVPQESVAFQVESDIWTETSESNLYDIVQLRDLKAAYSKHNAKKRI